MTRILFWNIDNFSLRRIQDNSSALALARSVVRLNHIVQDVFMQNPPDIFVIVEVFDRKNNTTMEGVPVVNNANLAVMHLLTTIRAATGNANWSLVPPISSGLLGFAEGVAVYYNSNNLQFLGPYVWGPDYRTASRTEPLTRACPVLETDKPNTDPDDWPDGPEDYDGSWNGCFAQTRAHPDPNMPDEDQCAAQWEFYNAWGTRLTFPSANERSPCLTTFLDLTTPAPHRVIKLFSLHTSPSSATQAVRDLADIQELDPAANEVSVVAGDFNVDGFSWGMAPYQPLLTLGFTMHLDPRHAGAVDQSRRPYCMTHMLPTVKATPFGTTGVANPLPTANVYPRFGYCGSKTRSGTINNQGCLDNFFTKYGATAGGPAANCTVANTIVGTPYNAVTGAPAAVANLTGGLTYGHRMANPIPLPAGENSTLGVASTTTQQQFRTLANFGRIRDTSDHLPLVIDV